MSKLEDDVVGEMAERFYVIYDGWALEHHLMDVRDLAPAMIAVNDLLSNANKALNGDKADLNLKVNASFRAGSFGMELHTVVHFLSQIRDMFAGDNASAISNAWTILEIVGFVGGAGLIGLIKFLKGKKPTKIIDEDGRLKVYLNETEYYETDGKVVKLYKNRTIVGDLNKMLEPLEKDGIDSFFVSRTGDKKDADLAIDDSELTYFEYQEIENDLSENITETFVQIEAAVFKDNNKWKFDNGGSPINAAILDEEFLRKIDSGELRFGKGDLLKVKLKTIQTFAHGKLKTEFQVIEVLEHKIVKQGHLEF
ncbi:MULTISPECIES: hypothetical protein [Acinetobacter]|jgi:hypothetical protein|nr:MULTISPECIES: hypothetical protein [Acinetobacter]MCK4081954.1 hypothetical protein [Acinetobacter radioresistens]MCK4091276.1 hypothetical protein [Acinetobacter radioresistens]MCM1936555.1 hypothetical protein [Acinetobacter radioresistens]MCM1954171.1 hypothetical protein [Acinetobacter radioresistens]MCU4310045.1 hypothetical protein [Acinetobacter radioresistens]